MASLCSLTSELALRWPVLCVLGFGSLQDDTRPGSCGERCVSNVIALGTDVKGTEQAGTCFVGAWQRRRLGAAFSHTLINRRPAAAQNLALHTAARPPASRHLSL
ncbi:hypothetical protein AAFF_G00385220 [Aldrovandia affinis]|uniref:Secreted protein n=1 Tax=Aldrovandia affinis TaxID=143900 RepID=A0AAD7WLD6_9TELE|nr:hypothetical protein AAFF_G00385220 [Aldrovandia affinis]